MQVSDRQADLILIAFYAGPIALCVFLAWLGWAWMADVEAATAATGLPHIVIFVAALHFVVIAPVVAGACAVEGVKLWREIH